jgi:SAM-dependent methyltransferase
LFDTIALFARAPVPGGTGERPVLRLRALDLACGTGLSTAGLVERGYSVTGVDIASEMLARARQRFARDCAFYVARAEALPFADSAFGLVACGQAFHWFDAAQSFGEIARVLRGGGTVALFWKHALNDDPFEALAAALLREISGRDEPHNVSRAHGGRFDEFWGERRAFCDHEEWRLPIELSFTVDSFVGYHSSREIARFHLGDRRTEFLTRLRNDVAGLAAGGAFAVKAAQYLYLARRR